MTIRLAKGEYGRKRKVVMLHKLVNPHQTGVQCTVRNRSGESAKAFLRHVWRLLSNSPRVATLLLLTASTAGLSSTSLATASFGTAASRSICISVARSLGSSCEATGSHVPSALGLMIDVSR